MIDVKTLIAKLLNSTKTVITNVTPTSVAYGTFTTCRFTQIGNVVNLYVSFRVTTAMAANTSYNIGTLPTKFRPVTLGGLSGADAVGHIASAGVMTVRPTIAKGANSNLYLTGTYIVGGVLRRSVIATLSAISKIGGGLSVKHKSCLAAYTDLDIRALRWCKLAIYKLWHTDYSNTIKERMACSLLDSAKRSNLRASTEDPDRHRDNSGRHRLDAKWKLHSLLLLCKKRSDIQYCSIPLIDNICETILIDPYERWWLYA